MSSSGSTGTPYTYKRESTCCLLSWREGSVVKNREFSSPDPTTEEAGCDCLANKVPSHVANKDRKKWANVSCKS